MIPQVSIIVPVYNVAPYLRHCLQSILEQGLERYEVILVNDASTDNSMGICIDWCNEHPAFRLLNHSKNKGLSEARNTGLDDARGEIISFVDSDDFLAPGTLKAAAEAMEGEDVVEFPVAQDYLSKQSRRWEPAESTLRFDEWMLKDGFTHCYAWNKLYRASLWKGIRFPAGRIYEDILTIPRILEKATKIRGIRQGTYYYCMRNASIAHTYDMIHCRQYVQALVELMEMPINRNNTALYIGARNGQILYRRCGGKEKLVPHREIPWSYIIKKGLTCRERLKAFWLKYMDR